MAYRTILNVARLDSGDRDLDHAIALCEPIEAHLSVLVLGVASPPPMGDAAMGAEVWAQERQTELKRLQERVASITKFLAGSALSADVASDYPDLAAVDDVVGRQARYTDLVVVGPDLLDSEVLRPKVVEGTLFASGRPVLLLPENSRPTLRPKRVLVAWDSSLEAARAVREALDMLVTADDVRLVLVDPVAGETGQGAEPGADAAAYLARHGVKVAVDRLPSSGQSVAAVLARRAADMDAELMVMGGYGHSRLRERVFGGVTRSMLAEPPLPILMAR
ncbi:universal stress protein [Mesorhizobium sp. L-8-3]|uniref:universal stress protein n=1 Tax=Mesorhizobium sp. L-8-3 TaxID=2744522 RepID=UPI001925D747|nr:universal stress protein [Mesorhizobium sp. L-8-3]BCH25303.1 universal stress protein [Mesorhizobium sp. L-8-3]